MKNKTIARMDELKRLLDNGCISMKDYRSESEDVKRTLYNMFYHDFISENNYNQCLKVVCDMVTETTKELTLQQGA